MLFMVLLQVVLIALNAIFACAEIAVISMNDNKLAKLAAEGDIRAVRLARLTSQPARFLATIQVAITLSGFLGSAFAAENFSDPIVKLLVGIGLPLPENTVHTIVVVLITIILSYFTLVFGELVPKRLAMRKAESLALGMSGLISTISKVFAPLVSLLTVSTNFILRLLKINPDEDDSKVSEEEIRMMVDVGSEKGAIDHEERVFIQNVFEFDDITADDIATHRTEIKMLHMSDSMENWKQIIYESRYTRYPICEDSTDDIIGILNAKEYFRLDDQSRENVMKQAVISPYFVLENVKADVLFRNMKSSGNQMAVVLDEYGVLSGIVTMNDLLEQLVGDLGDDVNDVEIKKESIVKLDDNTWKVSGRVEIEEVEAALGISVKDNEHNTFNGYVFNVLGTIPQDGESVDVETENLSINILEIDEHQIKTALVHKK